MIVESDSEIQSGVVAYYGGGFVEPWIVIFCDFLRIFV